MAHSFTDRNGRTWSITLDVGVLKRVRAETQIDLLAVVSEPKLIERLSLDACLLADVLFSVCSPACTAAGISAEEFGRGLAGDAIEHAVAALLEELIDFFPRRKADVLRKAMRKIEELSQLAIGAAGQRIDDLNAQAAVDKLFATLGS